MERDGFRFIDLKRKCPDGIAIKEDKVFAVEVLGMQYREGKGWHKKWTYKSKKENYDMFDDVIIKPFKYPKKRGKLVENKKELKIKYK